MYKKSTPLFLICETPLHAGSGDALGVIDLPIQRERHTSFPKIEASSLKGALREAVENNSPQKAKEPSVISAFGSDDSGDTAGALAFTDARLLLFPVKSMKGVFAWITCPRVLKQFAKDMDIAYKAENPQNSFVINKISAEPSANQCYILGDNSDLVVGSGEAKKILLEEYAFTAIPKTDIRIGEKQLEDWLSENLFELNSYWANKAKTSIVILNDDDFKDFVNLSTEVITRIKIDNKTGTVAKGALFTEEYLPSESVLYSLVFAAEEFTKNESKTSDADNMATLTNNVGAIFQLGGNATLGKGILRPNFHIIPKP